MVVALVAQENIEEINTLRLALIDLTGLSKEEEENLLKWAEPGRSETGHCFRNCTGFCSKPEEPIWSLPVIRV